ncbi:MAG: DUF2442 domain-containing protein [Novosphingobium sp.]|nr:DUF2442 domain-containing protein [Novosphingobium sp.]
MTRHWSDAQMASAAARGQAMLENEPRALAARFDAKSGRIVVDLSNGATYAFPASLGQGLEAASGEQLAAVEIMGAGFGLHWESLDVDLSIQGLLAGRFGNRAWMSELARRAGSVKSPAKAAAARANGAKGGRPRKAG